MPRKGFIDLQVNGFKGADFSSPGLSVDDIHRVSSDLRKIGTIGYCATMITSELDVYRRNLPLIAQAMEHPDSRGCLLGIHMEGPYLSPEDGARGAHQSSRMRIPDREEFDRFQEWARGRIVLCTVAPEREGALPLIHHIKTRYEIAISLGHHLADRQTIQRAAEAGATLITHLGNGCPAHLPRHENLIFHQLAEDSLMAGLITDGHHLPADFIRIAIRCKGPERIFIVSDVAPIAGMQPGIYRNLDNDVRLTASGRIECLDSPFFVGSGRTMAECMRHLRSLDLLSEEELWRVGLHNPIQILRISPSEIRTDDLPDFEWEETGQ